VSADYVSPSKRTRRQVQSAIENDENLNPVEFEVEDISPSKTATPSRRQSLAASKATPVTPSTPRHRDAFTKGPATPRHVVMSAGKLFKRMTPHSALTPSSIQTVYHTARQQLARSADPGRLTGRDAEREQLNSFLQRCSSANPSGCLYVSGPPGTGKSAMIQAVTDEYATTTTGVSKAFVNCMSIKSSKDLCNTLLELLNEEHNLNEAQALATLEKLFVPKKKTGPVYLVVLDEIDHLLELGLETLYRLFEWSMHKTARVVMIGIANALDLTSRFLPRLKSKNLKPELLPFLPYTASQIEKIITARLKKLLPPSEEESKFVPFIHPAAILLCAKKVASQSGDLRKAFDICRRALDLVERETKDKHEQEAREKVLQMTPSRKPLGDNANLSSPPRTGVRDSTQVAAETLRAITVEDAPRVSPMHLSKVTAATFGNGMSQRLKCLNLQQKAALCALVALERRNKAAAAAAASSGTPSSKTQTLTPTVKMLYDSYCKLCKRDSVLHPLSSQEFREVVGHLEEAGLVTPVDGKTGSLVVTQTPSRKGHRSGFPAAEEKRVASCVGEKEVEQVTDDVGAGILKSILSGDALD
jgi:cell division control protein 6